MLYSVKGCSDNDLKLEYLCGLREAMQEGLMMIINLDFKVQNDPHYEFPVSFSIESVLPAGLMNRDSKEIISLFDSCKLEPPELIHPDF